MWRKWKIYDCKHIHSKQTNNSEREDQSWEIACPCASQEELNPMIGSCLHNNLQLVPILSQISLPLPLRLIVILYQHGGLHISRTPVRSSEWVLYGGKFVTNHSVHYSHNNSYIPKNAHVCRLYVDQSFKNVSTVFKSAMCICWCTWLLVGCVFVDSHVSFLAPRILKWPLQSRKICVQLRTPALRLSM